MWPGFATTTVLYKAGIYLNVDTATKFINRKTILEEINERYRDKRQSKEDIIRDFSPSEGNKFKRVVVITGYGKNRSYQIDGLDFNKNPSNLIFQITKNG